MAVSVCSKLMNVGSIPKSFIRALVIQSAIAVCLRFRRGYWPGFFQARYRVMSRFAQDDFGVRRQRRRFGSNITNESTKTPPKTEERNVKTGWCRRTARQPAPSEDSHENAIHCQLRHLRSEAPAAGA